MGNKFLSGENKIKFYWAIVGFLAISMLTSFGYKIDDFIGNAKNGQKAFEKLPDICVQLEDHERRLTLMERNSAILLEKVDNLEKRFDKFDNKLDIILMK